MSKAAYTKAIKGLPWYKHFLTPTFNGAINEFENAEGRTVSVLYTATTAQIIVDSTGVFTSKDIHDYVVKPKEIKHMSTSINEGVVIANLIESDDEEEIENVVEFNTAALKKYGLDSLEIRESIEARIKLLYAYASELGMELYSQQG